MVASESIGQFQSLLNQIKRNVPYGKLDTSDFDLTDRDLLLMQEAFTSSTRQKTIDEWDCSQNPEITSAGYRTMCTILTSPNVVCKSLLLHDNCMMPDSAQCLARMLLQSNQAQSLETFNVGANPEMGIEGFISIMTALSTNSTVRYLEINFTVPSEISSTLDQERLGRSAQLALASKRTRLKEFRFENAGLDDNFMIEFAKGLTHNHTLEHMTLSGNWGIPGCTALAKALRYNDTLRELVIDEFENVTELFVVTLCGALEYNTTLKVIELCGNRCTLTESTMQSILESFEYNDTLETFCCTGSDTKPVDKLLELKEEEGRIAPKKGSRKRYAIYSFLMVHYKV